MNPLQSRLAALRRHLRGVVLVRGAGLVIVLLVAGAAAAMALDWQVHLPAAVRALALVGLLGGAGYLVYQYLVAPLAASTDDLTLALRVEEAYPVLNDALASTVEFLREPGKGDMGGSPSIRLEAMRRAMRLAENCDFNKVIERRGLGVIGLSVLLLVPAAGLAYWSFPLAPTALARLLDPFGSHTWTTLTVSDAPDRVTLKRKYTIRGQVEGVIPANAKVRIEIDGGTEKLAAILTDDAGGHHFTATLDTSQRGKFRFRVHANDAVWPAQWHEVKVVPPPQLVALDGNLSPQIQTYPPAYTDLRLPDMSPGKKSIEVVAGTHVVYRAAIDRPVREAWITFHPKEAEVIPGLQLHPLMGTSGLDAAARLAAGHAVWGRVLPTMSPDRRQLTFRFTPWASGSYVLHLDDGNGGILDDVGELRVLGDPVPRVSLLKPSGRQTLLPTATLPLQVLAEDESFAVRSVYLELLRKDREGALEAAPRRVVLYRESAPGQLVARVVHALGGPPLPTPQWRLRPKQVNLTIARWSLKGLVQEGDVLYLQACADDFNDVYPFNPPGRSVVAEIHIVGKAELDRLLDERLAEVQQELVGTQKLQDGALKAVRDIRDKLRQEDKKLDPAEKMKLQERLLDQLDHLVEAEQTQRQIHKQVGVKPDEGLRDKLARLQQAIRDNELPPSTLQDRARTLNNELNRLAEKEIPQIQQHMLEARKELNAKLNGKNAGKEAAPRKSVPLDKTQKLQEEVKKSLDDLVRFLDPWATIHQVRTQAQELLDKQRDAEQQARKLEMMGRDASDDDVKRAVDAQKNVQERFQELLAKMREVGKSQAEKGDKQTAARLREAIKEAEKKATKASPQGAIDEAMQKARKALQESNGVTDKPEPNPGRAREEQKKALAGLEKMIAALEDRRDNDVQELLRKQDDADAKLERLVKEQDELHKKTKANLEEQDVLAKKKKELENRLAKKEGDPAKLKAELAKVEERMRQNQRALAELAKEQRQLQQLAREKARELARLQAEDASRGLDRAAEAMGQAAGRMESGENPDGAQKDARELLQEAKEDLEDAQDELMREQLARIADRLKGLKERQDGAIQDMTRLHQDSIERLKKWTTTLLRSLDELAENQKTLRQEVDSLREKIKGAKVFERILEKAGENMSEAAAAMGERREKGRTRALADEELADEMRTQKRTLALQGDASRRLQRLLDALKDEPPRQRPKPPQPPKDGQDPPKQDNHKLRGPGDGIPALAQLKALRNEQQEINDRTRAIVERQLAGLVAGGGAAGPAQVAPEVAPLTPEQRAELTRLRADQAVLRDLLEQMMRQAKEEEKGDNP